MSEPMYALTVSGEYVLSRHHSAADAERAAFTLTDNRVYRILVQGQPLDEYHYYNGLRLIDATFLAQRLVSDTPAYELEGTASEALFDALIDDFLSWAYLNPSPKFSKYATRPMYAFTRNLLDSVAHAINWSSLEKK